MLLVWGLAGAVILMGVIFCLRHMKHGYTSLSQDKARFRARFRAGDREIEDEQKDMDAAEQLHVLYAGVNDLLRLDGLTGDHQVETEGNSLRILTPDGVWQITLSMREQTLRGTHRVLHGRCTWCLRGFGRMEQFDDIASLMAHLAARLRKDDGVPPELPHLARRLNVNSRPF